MATATVARYSSADFASDVQSGLMRRGQKELPSKYLYDEVGSSLFETITVLPEYGLSRADERLLKEHAPEMIAPLLPWKVLVAELGSGSGKKTRWILEALGRRQATIYRPIEISATALGRCAKEFGDMQGVTVRGLERGYLQGLREVAANRRPDEKLLTLFLGSTIGNFDRAAGQQFLLEIRGILRSGDALLLGADLVKPIALLLAAYDDAVGVTSAFNLNLLARVNRELGAGFDLAAFRHAARYDVYERRIEMHLVSLREQTVAIPGAGCRPQFAEGETIWTESSYKYQPEELLEMAVRGGFRPEAQWVDEQWPFAETLLVAE